VTKRQEQILAALMLSWDVYRAFPTTRRLCGMVGLRSTGSAHRLLERLEAHGYLARPEVRKRQLVPTEQACEWWRERKQTAVTEKVGG